jgi:long-chain acyl-CoA synthetase
MFDELIRGPSEFEVVSVAPEGMSTIGYTSGTTGHPKGAMQSHRAVILNGADHGLPMGFTESITLAD